MYVTSLTIAGASALLSILMIISVMFGMTGSRASGSIDTQNNQLKVLGGSLVCVAIFSAIGGWALKQSQKEKGN